MTQIISINGGSIEYWTDLREAHQLVRSAQDLLKLATAAPQYYGRYNAEGDLDLDSIEENIGPWDDFDDAINRVCKHHRAKQIALTMPALHDYIRYL